MRRANWRALAAAAAVCLMSGLSQAGPLGALPDTLVLRRGGRTALPASVMMAARVEATDGGTSVCLNADGELEGRSVGEARLTYRLLGVVPVKTIGVSVKPERRLIPGGQSVGVAIDTAGVIVVGASDLGSTPSPARLAGLKAGDVIRSVNGSKVNGAKALSAALDSGDTVRVDYEREGRAMSCSLTPALDVRDGSWRLGAWVRDSTAGIGTLTFIDPDTGAYGALGHAITDVDTGVRMPVGEGALYTNRVVDLTPGKAGSPGELTGDFIFDPTLVGSVDINTDSGLFGRTEAGEFDSIYPDGLPAAGPGEVRRGAAQLLTTIDDSGVKAYECEIVKINEPSRQAEKRMVVRITDQSLLSVTGGIVQGMSGSPIIQDGRLVGAVTHVMVNDPSMGYAIGIDQMLQEADRLGEEHERAA